MAQNPYVNKVIYGNQTVMDISGDTVTPADVASGKTFHDASGAAQTGTFAPVSITPSTHGTPQLHTNYVYKSLGEGYAIDNFDLVFPETSVAKVDKDKFYYIGGDSDYDCYVIDEDDVHTLRPLNNPPARITQQNYYYASQDGYAIELYSDATPDDSNPPVVSAGDIVRITTNGGYIYKTAQTGSLNPTEKTTTTLRNETFTLAIDSTKHYIVTSVMRVTSASATATRGGTWYVNKGVVSALQVDTNANADVTVSGGSMTLSATQASYRIEFRVIQLD